MNTIPMQARVVFIRHMPSGMRLSLLHAGDKRALVQKVKLAIARLGFDRQDCSIKIGRAR